MDNFHQYDMVFLGSDLPHSFNHDKKYIHRKGRHAPEAIVIHFQKDFLGSSFWEIPEMKEINRIIQLSRQGLKIYGKTRRHVAALMSKMVDASPEMRIIFLLQILSEIAAKKEYQSLATKGYNYSENYNDNDKISRIYQYTFDNFSRKIRIIDLAALLLLTPPSFCRYFKSRTRKTYTQFINEIRIGNACKLLIEDNINVKQICYECGYNNFASFHKFFKCITNKSPLNYQKEFLARNKQA